MDSSCDICGRNHLIDDCASFKKQFQDADKFDLDREESMAQRTLPAWIMYEKASGLVITNKSIAEGYKLGPLLAPQCSTAKDDNSFPLKILISKDISLWIDHSDKRKCCWLSLIPACDSDHNLLVCQEEESLYYVACKNIFKGEPLNVWYAPYYRKKFDDLLTNPTNVAISKQKKHNRDVDTKNDNILSSSKHKSQSSAVSTRKYLSLNMPHLNESAAEPSPYTVLPPNFSSAAKPIMTVTSTNAAHKNNIKCAQKPLLNFTSKLKPNETKHDACNNISAQHPNELSSPSPCSIFRKNFTLSSISAISVSRERVIFTNPFGNISYLINKLDKFTKPFRPPLKNTIRIKINTNDEDKSRTLTDNSLLNSATEKCSNDAYQGGKNIIESISIKSSTLEDNQPSVLVLFSESDSINRKSTLRDEIDEESYPRKNVLANSQNSCRHCGNKFQSTVHLASHLKDHLQCLLINHLKSHKVKKKNEKSNLINNEIIAHSIQKKSEELTWLGSYNCQICHKIFNKPQYLLRHLAKHLEKYYCDSCHKNFARKESLLSHNKQVHGCPDEKSDADTRLSCGKCDMTFTQLNRYKSHRLKHNGPIKCKNCGKFYSSDASIERHFRHCGYYNNSSQKVISKKEKLKEKYICGNCTQKYTKKAPFDEHVILCKQISLIEEKGESPCPECGAICRNCSEFRLHFQTHTHPFFCVGCTQHFKTKGTYELHVCSTELVCDRCHDSFSSVQGLNRHLSVHGPPPFRCSVCKIPYYRQESLQRHQCKVKTNNSLMKAPSTSKQHTCLHCLSTFSSKFNLKKHVASFHDDSLKQFACVDCGKAFHRSDLLKLHEKTHAGGASAPAFPCPECPKVLRSARALRVHATLHKEDFRFLCRYCNKAFPQRINLRRHERSHAPVGDVKCHHCGANCRSTQHLEKHLLIHTNLHESPLNGDSLVISKGDSEILRLNQDVDIDFQWQPILKDSEPILKGSETGSTSRSQVHDAQGTEIIQEIELTEQPTIYLDGRNSAWPLS